MISHRAIGAVGLGAVAFALITPVVAASADPAYRHCAQFISELGAAGAPHARLVNFAGFLPTGVLTILFTSLAARLSPGARARWGFLLLSGVGWAYVAAAFLPCDPGCPASGSTTQSIHNAFGVVEYLGGALGLLLLWSSPAPGRVMKPLSLVCAVIVLAAFAGMIAPSLHGARGLLQRGAETALFSWLLVASLRLWTFEEATGS